MLTLKIAQLFCRAIGVTLTHKNGEYRVAFSGKGNEASAYYTNDRMDAVNTARAMFKHRAAVQIIGGTDDAALYDGIDAYFVAVNQYLNETLSSINREMPRAINNARHSLGQ